MWSTDEAGLAQETRERVMKVAAEMGYRANAHAQQLVTRRSRILAIQMPVLRGSRDNVTALPNSEFFLELINGAAAAAESRQYVPIVLPSRGRCNEHVGSRDRWSHLVDPSGEEHVLGACLASGRPLVTVGVPVTDIGTAVAVENDHRRAAVRNASAIGPSHRPPREYSQQYSMTVPTLAAKAIRRTDRETSDGAPRGIMSCYRQS